MSSVSHLVETFELFLFQTNRISALNFRRLTNSTQQSITLCFWISIARPTLHFHRKAAGRLSISTEFQKTFHHFRILSLMKTSVSANVHFASTSHQSNITETILLIWPTIWVQRQTLFRFFLKVSKSGCPFLALIRARLTIRLTKLQPMAPKFKETPNHQFWTFTVTELHRLSELKTWLTTLSLLSGT